MKALYIIIYLIFSQFLLITSFCQYNNSPATLGVDFNINKYEGSSNSIPGVCINYTNGISPYYNYVAMVSGSFLDSAKKGIKENDKKLLLEGSLSLERKLVNPSARYQPFILAGGGIGYYNRSYGVFAPIGLGLQTKISNDVYLVCNVQYRFGIVNNLNSHYFFSIGLGGALGKKTPAKKQEKLKGNVTRSKKAEPISHVHDRDHDGILDSVDFCPDKAGILANHGCPVEAIPDISVQTLLDSLAKNILFETNSSSLKESSFSPLNEVVNILYKYPAIVLKVEGHTDSVGSAEDNLKLSMARANSIVNYLNEKGVLLYRLQPNGYGETVPIADNSTSEGRMLNRRVELKVKRT